MEIRPPLARQQVRDVIEFRGCDCVPILYHLWVSPRFDGSKEWNDKVRAILERYPFDISTFGIGQPDAWIRPSRRRGKGGPTRTSRR